MKPEKVLSLEVEAQLAEAGALLSQARAIAGMFQEEHNAK